MEAPLRGGDLTNRCDLQGPFSLIRHEKIFQQLAESCYLKLFCVHFAKCDFVASFQRLPQLDKLSQVRGQDCDLIRVVPLLLEVPHYLYDHVNLKLVPL